jgi:hypothetical protein
MFINREEFITALKAVKPGIAKQEIIDQSACIIFDAERRCRTNKLLLTICYY